MFGMRTSTSPKKHPKCSIAELNEAGVEESGALQRITTDHPGPGAHGK